MRSTGKYQVMIKSHVIKVTIKLSISFSVILYTIAERSQYDAKWKIIDSTTLEGGGRKTGFQKGLQRFSNKVFSWILLKYLPGAVTLM